MDKKRAARIGGLWYFAMAVTGPVGIIYVPSQIVVEGDALATAARMVEHAQLVRIGVASSLLCQLAFVFLMLTLVRLFEGVSEMLSTAMKALVLVAVPIAMLNEVFLLGALEFASSAGIVAEQRGAMVLALLAMHQQGVWIASIFWGLWLFPFGMLAIRSGFIPKVLGVLLVVGCCAYVIDSAVALLGPRYHDVVSSVLMLPLSLGELSMVVWLLVKGARVPPGAADQSILGKGPM